MSGVAAPALSAKCRGMYSRLLGKSDYDKLLKRDSVPQVAEYLKKETQYAYTLRRLNENDAHRGQLERVLTKSLFYDYEKLMGFSGGGCKAAIKAAFEAFEVSDIKLVISSIRSGHKQMLAAADLNYVRHYSSFGVNELLEPATIGKLAENLRNTRFYEVLLPFAAKESPDFLKIDCALDSLTHRSKLAAFSGRLKGSDRKACLDAYGQEVDVANIQFIYRMKKLFRYPASQIIASLIPHCHRLEKLDLVGMAECEDVDALVGIASRTRYKELFPPGKESAWEAIQAEWFYAARKKRFRRGGGGAEMALSYLLLKETDIRNVIAILEGIRYGIPTQQIKTLLVGYGAP